MQGMTATRQLNQGWQTSAVRMIMSALDDYHFPWLHKDVLGKRSRPLAPERTYETNESQLITRFDTEQPPNVTNSVGASRTAKVRIRCALTAQRPYACQRKRGRGKIRRLVCRQSRNLQQNACVLEGRRNYEDSDDKIIRMEKMIQAQDIPLVSGQRPWLASPVPIRKVDGAFVKYLQMLKAHNIPTNI